MLKALVDKAMCSSCSKEKECPTTLSFGTDERFAYVYCKNFYWGNPPKELGENGYRRFPCVLAEKG